MKTVNLHVMESEATLLDRYVTRRDEAAFRQIVERHAGMVLGVARRRTGDAALGEEAAQTVFTLLARKASSLRHLPPDKLGGWLHRTALLTAGNLLRSEMRRRQHLNRFASDSASAALTGPEEFAWRDALPLVDEAIDSLPDAERQLVVQHFYQRRTFREMSDGTGRTEDAVRKRTGRALERLSGFFKRRGVTLSATALMTGLSARVSEAAPAGYATSAAASAVSGASSVSTFAVISNTLATMALTKVTIAASVVAFVAPLGLHWRENAAASQPAAPGASGSIAKEPGANGARVVHRTSSVSPESAAAGSAVLKRFAQELAKVTPPPSDALRLAELQRLVFEMPEDELPRAFDMLRTASATEALGPVAAALTARWAETDPREALRKVASLPQSLHASGWSGALQVWARRDFNAAFAWACAQPDGEDRNAQLDTVYNDLMKRDPSAALARLKEVPSEAKQKQFRRWTFEVWRNSDPDAAISWINTNEPEESRDKELNEFISGWAPYRPDLGVANALKHLTNPHQRKDTIQFALMQMGMHDPAGAIQAIVNLPPDMQTANMARNAAPFIANGDTEGLLDAVGKLPAGEFRDALQASVIHRVAATDLKRAREIAAGISSTESRQQASMSIANHWLKSEPQAARQWIEKTSDLSADMKKHLLEEKR